MMLRALLVTICVLIGSAAILSIAQEGGGPTTSASPQITVTGVVYGSNGKPIDGVAVSLYVPGATKSVRTVRSNGGGRFELRASTMRAFEIVYSHSRYDLEVVCWLAGVEDHSISKIIYKRGEKRPLAALHATLESAERVAVSRNLLAPDKRDAFLELVNLDGAPHVYATDEIESLIQPEDGIDENRVAALLPALKGKAGLVSALMERRE